MSAQKHRAGMENLRSTTRRKTAFAAEILVFRLRSNRQNLRGVLRTKRNRPSRGGTARAARAAERMKTPAYLSGSGRRFSMWAISQSNLRRSASNRITSAASVPLVPVQAPWNRRALCSIRTMSFSVRGWSSGMTASTRGRAPGRSRRTPQCPEACLRSRRTRLGRGGSRTAAGASCR